MKLSTAATIKYSGSEIFNSVPILEGEASPRWSFKYDNFDHDPTPDVLVLGMYRHPNTGNNLVGAINLRYLDKQQIEQLQRILPKLHQTKNLKRRYYMGISLLPEVFENYYRTYNAEHIRDLKRGSIYPKYGILKTAANYVKKKATDVFKSKQQKEKEAMPQYPSDIADIDSRIDQAVRQVAQAPPQEVPAQDAAAAQRDVVRQQQEPERSVAQQDALGQKAVERARAAKEMNKQVERGQALSPRQKQQQAYQADQQQIEKEKQTLQPPAPQVGPQTEPQAEPEVQPAPEPNIQKAENTTDKIDIDTNDTEDIQFESIRYWSPSLNKYITEIIHI